ncbi:aldo/keto reductase [Streptomyces sp. NBC_01216]|uniref:aldo/keto reductase n=1 Tax=Streptomyces sp. NBC_01216 TaxID=2903778 RepID=UPI002E162D27
MLSRTRPGDAPMPPVFCAQNTGGIGASPEQKEFLDLCGERRIAFVPFHSIAGTGRTAGATTDDGVEVLAVARAHGVGTARIRLAWTLHQGPHVLTIPGTGDPGHLAQNVAAGPLRLSADGLTSLNSPRHAVV